jgi:hypothetical protein
VGLSHYGPPAVPGSSQLGIVIEGGARLREPQTGVDLVLVRNTLIEPPRRAGARKVSAALRSTFPGAELIPYVWHLVTHEPGDGLADAGTRTLAGPPHQFGGLKDTPQVAQAWESMCAAASGFGAERVVLRTAASLSPGAVGRMRLTKFVERARADGLTCIWQPSGLWEPAAAAQIAGQLDIPILWPFAALGRGSTAAPASAWTLVEQRSRGKRLNPDHLDILADQLTDGPGTVIFGGEHAVRHLRELRAAL